MPDPLPLVSLNHVARLTKRVEESTAFYRDVLGFRVLPRPDFTFGGAWLTNCGFAIHLIEDPSIGDASGPVSARDNHLAFHVADMDAVQKRLQEHGVEHIVNTQSGTGMKQIFFRDPDGHHVEVATYGAPGG